MMQGAIVLSRLLVALLVCTGCGAAWNVAAQTNKTSKGRPSTTQTAPASSDQEADTIVAVVNKDIITQRELTERVAQVRQELSKQKAPLPPEDALQREVLQRLIQERLEQQEAKRQKIEVTDQMLNRALDSIAQRNKTTVANMRKQVEASGMNWAQYTSMIRREVMLEGLRQRVVDSTILISDAEVDAYLKDQSARQSGGLAALAQQGAQQQQAQQQAQQQQAQQQAPQGDPNQPPILGLSQILIRVPEGTSKEQLKEYRARADAIMARLRAGESFEAVAQASSEGPEAGRGGELGVRPVEGWPDLFLKAVANVKDGQISGIIQSPNGFHILKVLGRAGGRQSAPPPSAKTQNAPPPQQAPAQARGPGSAPLTKQGPMPVQQTKARHILIKTTQVVSDEIAQQKLAQIRERLVEGKEPFSDLAKRFSNDSSAPQGGDLGWLNPGETVPPFENAMNALKIGEVSQPVKSQFGWHLIVVDDRRTEDIADQFLRNQVRQKLFMQRSDAAFENWLQQVRNQSYIDNRLEKRLRQDKE